MFRFFLAALLVAPGAFAQFSELAATGDGRQLYFSSTLRLRGMPAGLDETRTYRWSSGNVELFAERVQPGLPGGGFSFASGDGARTPRVSDDGETVAYTVQGVCDPDVPQCVQMTSMQVIVSRWGETRFYGSGTVHLSGNGQWALIVRDSAPGTPAAGSLLLHLPTGEARETPAAPFSAARPLTSNGAVLVTRTEGQMATPGIWRAGAFEPLAPISGAFAPWGLSDDGSTLLYTSLRFDLAQPAISVFARDLASNSDTLVVRSRPGENVAILAVSRDGRRMLYRTVRSPSGAGHAYVADRSTGQIAWVPLDAGEMATGGTLAAHGIAAFLSTTRGRIVRYDFGAPAVSTVVPATPYLDRPGMALVPGSLARLYLTTTGSAETLAGRIRVEGLPLIIRSVNGTEVVVQAPWELHAPANAPLVLDFPSESPFVPEQTVRVAKMSPAFEPPGSPRFIKADWSGYVAGTPKPGEIVHLYMTGLGAVQGEAVTGQAAPLDAVHPIRNQFVCRFGPYEQDAETLFAGLAPGLVGIYQVTFRMPETDAPGGVAFAGDCRWSSPSGGGGFTWVGLPAPAP